MRKALIAGLLLLLPLCAHATVYDEFAPDYSQPLMVQPDTTVAELFAPLNDHLSAIDLWVSTGGMNAGLNMMLQNETGTVVATQTVALGTIPDSTGGTRIQILLPTQIAVRGNQTYRLSLTPTGAAIKIYFSPSVSVVPGSGTASSTAYRYGVAVVDGLDQGYSFKFALSETLERVAPVVSGVRIDQPAIGQAFFTFNATEPVDVQVAYGSTTSQWTGEYTPCLEGIMLCSVLLNVTPGATYSYTATVRDEWGNSAVVRGSFTSVGEGPTQSAATPTPTPSPSPTRTPTPSPTATATPTPVNDHTPPVIISPRLVQLTPTSVTVAWSTNEAANSLAVILSLGRASSDPTLELEHYLTIGGLLPDHYYRMRVSSSDFWGNYADVLIIFTTPRLTTPTPTVTAPPPGASTPPATPTPTPVYTVITSPGPLPPPTVPPSPSATPTASPGVSPTATVTTTPTAQTNPSSSPTPTAVAYPATSTQPGEINWPAATGTVDGYRVDIFDGNGVLIKTVTVNASTTSVPLPAGVPSNARIIVYADRGGGAFEKVSAPITLSERTSASAVQFKAPSVPVMLGAGILLTALISAWVMQRRRQRIAASTPPPVVPGIPPAPGTGMPS